jgi:hypothetical protein
MVVPEAGLQPYNVHMGLAPVGEIFPAVCEQAEALGLGEAAPDAVRLADGQGMRGTLRAYGATPAYRFCCHLPPVTR